MSNWFADALDAVGTALHAPELGLSETASGGAATANTLTPAGIVTGQATSNPAYINAFAQPAGAGPSVGGTGGVSTAAAADPNAGTTQASAAQAAGLRGSITDIANQIKDIFNQRYGQVDQSAQEQAGKLNDRFGTESKDITDQANTQTGQVGAAAAGTGTYDSSYRGNNVDTVTNSANGQVRDLGTELSDNLNAIAEWVKQQKAGFDANKTGIDQVVSHLAQETDPGNLQTIRNTLEGRIADLNSTSADNNTTAQNASTLESIAPSSARAVQLKTTLASIIGGNADASQKTAIAQKLISSAGLSGADAQALTDAFNSDLEKTKQQPTA